MTMRAIPRAKTVRDTGWDTRFWSFGARTNLGPLVLIAQAMRGYTVIAGPGFISDTKFQSAFVLASYDLDDWRFSLREDLFATRRPAPPTTSGRKTATPPPARFPGPGRTGFASPPN